MGVHEQPALTRKTKISFIVSRRILSMFEYRREELLSRDLLQLNMFPLYILGCIGRSQANSQTQMGFSTFSTIYTYMCV